MAIADEVVNVLQTFGFIFGLSDAIIGLTIFAVGNSLADLVANMTVAVSRTSTYTVFPLSPTRVCRLLPRLWVSPHALAVPCSTSFSASAYPERTS